MEESFSDHELQDLHRLLQQMALAAYPNPQRAGCPGSAVLDEVASAPIPFKHPAYEHVKRCSPCLKEMLDLRGAKIRSRQAASRRRKKIWVVTGVLAACFIVSLLFFTQRNAILSKAPRQTASIILQRRTADLFEKDVLRGAGEPPAQTAPLDLPAIPLELKVILPRFSRSGTYQIAVCRDRNSESTMAKTLGQTVAEGPREVVTVILDLSRLQKGAYWLSTRYDDNDASDYFALRLQ